MGARQAHGSRRWGGKLPASAADAFVSREAASLLAALTHRLSPAQRQEALAGIDRAAHRCVVRHATISQLLRVGSDLLAQPSSLPQLSRLTRSRPTRTAGWRT